jgi:hypothetical protein
MIRRQYQLGQALGARIIATAGGADAGTNYRKRPIADQVRAATKGAWLNVVVDPVGGEGDAGKFEETCLPDAPELSLALPTTPPFGVGSSDFNPLYADPDFAAAVGFPAVTARSHGQRISSGARRCQRLSISDRTHRNEPRLMRCSRKNGCRACHRDEKGLRVAEVVARDLQIADGKLELFRPGALADGHSPTGFTSQIWRP